MSAHRFLFVLFLLRFHLNFASPSSGSFRRENSLHLQKTPLHALEEADDTRGLAANRRLKMMKPCTTEPSRQGIKCSFDADVPNSRIMLDSKLVETTRQKMKSVEGRSTREMKPHDYAEVSDSNKGDEREGEDVEVKDYAQPARKPPIHNEEAGLVPKDIKS